MTRDSSEAVSFFVCLIGNIHYKSSLSEKDNKNDRSKGVQKDA